MKYDTKQIDDVLMFFNEKKEISFFYSFIYLQ